MPQITDHTEVTGPRIAAVIPCYRVAQQILSVLSRIGPEVTGIFVVDDCCPEGSGELVQSRVKDPRVRVLRTPVNSGVGGATLLGMQAAASEGFEILVKLDGDGQMDPGLIPSLVSPLLEQRCDYVKGNRFYALESLGGMPALRLLGNSFLSFINKAVTGYWNLMDPTNGFVAIQSSVLKVLPLEKIDKRYFFESDMLFRLSTFRAVVSEFPMDAVYQDEKSNLRIGRVIRDFPPRYFLRFWKRIFYTYFLRDFNVCSVYLVSASLLLASGAIFGIRAWIHSAQSGVFASDGTVMLAALPIILGFQSLLAAISYDVQHVPSDPLVRFLAAADQMRSRLVRIAPADHSRTAGPQRKVGNQP